MELIWIKTTIGNITFGSVIRYKERGKYKLILYLHSDKGIDLQGEMCWQKNVISLLIPEYVEVLTYKSNSIYSVDKTSGIGWLKHIQDIAESVE